MNRDEKAAVIEEVARQIQEAEAIYAVDYRGASVPQAAELRARLRDADATFRVVKNTLTERAADQAGAEGLKVVPRGPDRDDVRARRRGRGRQGARGLPPLVRPARVQGRLDERRGAVARADGRDRAPAHPRRALRPARRHGRVAAHRARHEPRRADRRAGPPARPDRRAGPRRRGCARAGGGGCGPAEEAPPAEAAGSRGAGRRGGAHHDTPPRPRATPAGETETEKE